MSFHLRAVIMAMMLLGLVVSSCGRELRVHLVQGECDLAQMEWGAILALRAELMRDRDGLTVRSACLATKGELSSFGDIGRFLGASAIFNDLPAEGSWTVRVQGFFTETCLRKTSVVCGRRAGVDLGASPAISLPLDCAPRVATAPPKAFKACIDDL